MSRQEPIGPYLIHTQAYPQPFFLVIMEEQVLPHYMVPKITLLSGLGDLESHLKLFEAQMLILGDSDIV